MNKNYKFYAYRRLKKKLERNFGKNHKKILEFIEREAKDIFKAFNEKTGKINEQPSSNRSF